MGTIVALHLSSASRTPLASVERVTALVDRGLEGDHRHTQRPRAARQVLLMEQEVLDQFGLAPGDVREQITVRGLALADLERGARLRVGGAVFEVGGLCAPCERMDELRAGLRALLQGRRGRFVRVVESGSLAVGDAIVIEPAVRTV